MKNPCTPVNNPEKQYPPTTPHQEPPVIKRDDITGKGEVEDPVIDSPTKG